MSRQGQPRTSMLTLFAFYANFIGRCSLCCGCVGVGLPMFSLETKAGSCLRPKRKVVFRTRHRRTQIPHIAVERLEESDRCPIWVVDLFDARNRSSSCEQWFRSKLERNLCWDRVPNAEPIWRSEPKRPAPNHWRPHFASHVIVRFAKLAVRRFRKTDARLLHPTALLAARSGCF